MASPEVHEHYKALFSAWRKIDSSYHVPTNAEDKFGAILRGEFDEAVLSLAPEPSDEKGAEKPWLRRLRKRHEDKRQRALMLLSDLAFQENMLALASKWGLDKHLYGVDPIVLWHSDGLDGTFCWDTFLLFLSIRYLQKYGAAIDAARQKLATQYASDLDFAALKRGLAEIDGRLPVRQFASEVSTLARTHGLSPLWDMSVKALLLSGTLPVPYQDCRIVLQRGDENRLFIEVFAETRKQDVDDKWRFLSELLESFFPGRRKRRRRRTALERDLDTQRELAEGRGIEEIILDDYDLEGNGEFGSLQQLVLQRDFAMVCLAACGG